jgi:hypothetical protein
MHVTEQMPFLWINNEKIKDPGKVAGVFNSLFLSIAENLNLCQMGKEDPISFLKDAFPCKFHGFKIVPTSEAEIKRIILSLKSKNLFDCDEITSKILKACACIISRPLSHICNHSLYIQVFPDCLKISLGDKTSMTNCKPISLLTVFSKVLEKAMYNRLSHHMHTNDTLVPE